MALPLTRVRTLRCVAVAVVREVGGCEIVDVIDNDCVEGGLVVGVEPDIHRNLIDTTRG